MLVVIVNILFAFAIFSEASNELKDLDQINQIHNQFGSKLLKKVQSENNVLVSPINVLNVLAMLLPGTDGSTREQIFQTLGYAQTSFTVEQIASQFEQINQVLDSEERIKMANALVTMPEPFHLDPKYKSVLSEDFHAEEIVCDFQNNTSKATKTVNQWVSEKTNGKIAKLFENDLNINTKLLLLSAIYFSDNWKFKFNQYATNKNNFYTKNGPVEVDMMLHTFKLINYGEFQDGQLVELPFKSGASMFIFVPKENNTEFDLAEIDSRIEKLEPENVQLSLPRFTIKMKNSLTNTLKQMGIVDMFDVGKANLSKMTTNQMDLFVSDVMHETYLKVNESGCEAAAVSAVILLGRSLTVPRKEPKVVRADHPFLVFIKYTQINLFAGIIEKP